MPSCLLAVPFKYLYVLFSTSIHASCTNKVCMPPCMYVFVCAFVCVCMYVCMYVCICMYVCMHVCISMYICMHACMYVEFEHCEVRLGDRYFLLPE